MDHGRMGGAGVFGGVGVEEEEEEEEEEENFRGDLEQVHRFSNEDG